MILASYKKKHKICILFHFTSLQVKQFLVELISSTRSKHMTNPTCKFRYGNFEGWLMGKMNWCVVDRRTREVVAMATNMNECSRIAQRFYDFEKQS
jgi:hypothetical protein